jgi:hypothetical protein
MEELKAWSVKFLLPSLVAISIKLAVQSRNGISWFNVTTSIVTAIGSAYLFGPIVVPYLPEHWHNAAVASVAISGEKIGFWLVYKLNVENVLKAFYKNLFSK